MCRGTARRPQFQVSHAAPLELLLARLGARDARGGRVGGARVVDGGHLRGLEPRALDDLVRVRVRLRLRIRLRIRVRVRVRVRVRIRVS